MLRVLYYDSRHLLLYSGTGCSLWCACCITIVGIYFSDFETDCREWRTWRLYKVTGQDFFLSCPRCFFPHLFSCSYFLPLFHCLISILLFPCGGAWEDTRAWVPHFLIAILNGTCSLRALILFCGDEPAIKTNLNKQHLLLYSGTGCSLWCACCITIVGIYFSTVELAAVYAARAVLR